MATNIKKSNIEIENEINNGYGFSLLNLLPSLSLPKVSVSILLKPLMSVLLFVSVLLITFYILPHSTEWVFSKKEFILELSNMIPDDEAQRIRFVAEQANADTWATAQSWTTLACQGVFLATTLLGAIAFKLGSKIASNNIEKEIEASKAPLQRSIKLLKEENNLLQKEVKKQVELNAQLKEESPLLKEEAEKFRLLVEILSSPTSSATIQPSYEPTKCQIWEGPVKWPSGEPLEEENK
jgi:hypothetical protein